MRQALWALGLLASAVQAQSPAPALRLEDLPRYTPPPQEQGTVVPEQVLRWREEAIALEHGEHGLRDPERAAQLYCRAARFGDAESQFNLAWMLTNSRGILRDEAQAAHLFAAAAEQGMPQAQNMMARLGEPLGPPPPCLRPPDGDPPPLAAKTAPAKGAKPAERPWPAPPAQAPEVIVRFVNLVAPEYQLAPALVLAIVATESNFNPNAVSPKNAQGLMQLIPDTAKRFGVRNLMDPTQNLRGGMAYLRWLLAYYEGDISLAAAAYNAGEGAVNRYRGIPPYAETRLYVRKILAHLGGRRDHPFDAKVTDPSPALALIRGPSRWQ
ncbi:transglycosylase SLT domain-containing protein [Inhella crocodyli]|uniref:Lytic transglycosylase n=1 Tax=Inhella crocodyli TaxID=2499851 RepID=A0A437LE24_9BURK|nr:transglycosylase SLT domain-containing protein [Inhella crocodyli]RVT83594.1 lytic transglycosylase [Inhella crocodyli]